MPFLRVVRDKRGYETTYLIHSVRDGTRTDSRVVYVFRSPGGVRVGRSPFEPEVRREIEARNPAVSFDWDALVSEKQLIDATPDTRRPRRRPASGEGGTPPPPPRRPEPAPQTPRLVVPSAVEGDTPELQMRFLAHWHGLLCERLPQRVSDPQRREAMMTLVQKLNPAGWVDADEIAAGLQQASEALEQLSRILVKRRRKSRRSGTREPVEGPDARPPGPEGEPEEPPTAESDSDEMTAAAEDGDTGEADEPDDSSIDEPDQT